MGGSRCGRLRKNLNIIIVMLVSGIWHGAGLHFVVWGLLNGLFQVFDDLTAKLKTNIPKIIQICATFFCICFCWLFFRANSLTTAFGFIKMIIFNLEPKTLTGNLLLKYGLNKSEVCFLLLSIFVLMICEYLKWRDISLKKNIFSRKWYIQSVVFIAGLLTVAVFGVWGSEYNPAAFIYFQF